MLTGDNPTTANAIAKEAGIDEVIAGCCRTVKPKRLNACKVKDVRVAMVGDGINDAPALAQADVGIAMGGGSDVAIETAAITLMRHSLMGVADALAISRATLRNMKQNLLGAFLSTTALVFRSPPVFCGRSPVRCLTRWLPERQWRSRRLP